MTIKKRLKVLRYEGDKKDLEEIAIMTLENSQGSGELETEQTGYVSTAVLIKSMQLAGYVHDLGYAAGQFDYVNKVKFEPGDFDDITRTPGFDKFDAMNLHKEMMDRIRRAQDEVEEERKKAENRPTIQETLEKATKAESTQPEQSSSVSEGNSGGSETTKK